MDLEVEIPEGYKLCGGKYGCYRVKSLNKFRLVKQRPRKDGRRYYLPCTYCFDCESRMKDAHYRANKEQYLDRIRKWDKENPRRKVTDGEKLVQKKELVPLGPFQRWLLGLTISPEDLEKLTGIAARQYRRYMNGYEYTKGKRYEIHRVDLDTVDQTLLAEGSTLLQELYPELYDMDVTFAA